MDGGNDEDSLTQHGYIFFISFMPWVDGTGVGDVDAGGSGGDSVTLDFVTVFDSEISFFTFFPSTLSPSPMMLVKLELMTTKAVKLICGNYFIKLELLMEVVKLICDNYFIKKSLYNLIIEL